MSKPTVRIVVDKKRGGAQVTLYDPNSGRTAPGGPIGERDIQKRVEEISAQARAGGNNVEVLDR